MATSDVAFQAYHGQGQFEGDKQPIYALFSMYPSLQHFISVDPEIKSVRDLSGKRISVGALGSGCEILSRLIIEAAGLSYDDIQVSHYSQLEAVQAMRDRNIDVLFYNFAYPGTVVQEITKAREVWVSPGKIVQEITTVYFVPIDEDIIEKLTGEYGYYTRGVLPAGVYQGQDKEVPSIQVGNEVVINIDIEGYRAYRLVRLLFDWAYKLYDVHPVTKQLIPENGVKTSIPLHPGAEKYFEELGGYYDFRGFYK